MQKFLFPGLPVLVQRLGLWCGALVLSWALFAGVASADEAPIPLETLKGWSLCVASDASASEQYAAEEFQSLFRQLTGTTLPMERSGSRTSRRIYVGPGAAAAAGASGFDAAGMGQESLRIRITSDAIVIAGGRPRGTLYGVYEFFERYLGCEFLTHDQTYFPPVAEIAPLPLEDYSYTPPFSFRWSYYKANSDHPKFAVRNRINTVANQESLGGKTPQSLIGHSYYQWITPEKYGAAHPEYFAMVDGVRLLKGEGGGPQPCVSNPEVIDIIAKGVLAALDANPALRNIAVSQNDNAEYCRCPQCEAINVSEDSPAAANLLLVNAVAERVEQTHPGVMVGTLTYWYTRKPPKTVKPRANVQLQLCSIECCTLHPINDPVCVLNRSFCEDLKGWKAVSDQIWIWNYNTNFPCYDLPFPNLNSIGPNVQFFLENHAKGVFMQGNANSDAGEMSHLRNYVISKCLWKPGQDSWALAQRFCKLYYGPAADDMIDYLAMIHRVSEEAGLHPDCGPTAERLGLTPAISRDILARFARMMSKAGNETFRARVEEASIPGYKSLLMTTTASWDYANGKVKRSLPAKTEETLDKYVALCKKYNLTMNAESVTLEKFLQDFRDHAETPATQIENAVWRVTVTPDNNGAVVGLFHKPSGHEMLRAMRNFNIEKGIITTFVETGTYRKTENVKCTAETTPTAIRCLKTLPDGTREERVVRLSEQDPGRVQVEFNLVQASTGSQAWRFFSQAGFLPSTQSKDAGVLSVYVNGTGWQTVNRDWAMDHGPDGALLKKVSGGAYAFYDHEAKYGALIRYRPEEVGELFLYWHPERPQVNLELRTPLATVPPGKSLKLAYTIEYLAEAPQD